MMSRIFTSAFIRGLTLRCCPRLNALGHWHMAGFPGGGSAREPDPGAEGPAGRDRGLPAFRGRRDCKSFKRRRSTGRQLTYNAGGVRRRGAIMAGEDTWVDIGAVETLSAQPLQRLRVKNVALAISFKDGQFGVVSNACNHVGGPLGEGRLDGDYIVCPWHHWKFHRCTGEGEPGFEEDACPGLCGEGRERPRAGRPRAAQPSARASRTRRIRWRARSSAQPGPLRVAGISTTAMDEANPRFSASDHLLDACARRRRSGMAPRRA